jgi:hypothetical protein
MTYNQGERLAGGADAPPFGTSALPRGHPRFRLNLASPPCWTGRFIQPACDAVWKVWLRRKRFLPSGLCGGRQRSTTEPCTDVQRV